MKQILLLISLSALVFGCAGTGSFINPKKVYPPEFDQKIMLVAYDDYEQFQAGRSGYDIGDLQSFHSQHTFSLTAEGFFRDIFGQVQVVEPNEPVISLDVPDVAAVFEIKILDLAHDIYNESTSYRSHVTIATAMKSPRGEIFWQKAVRGEGSVNVDPQYSTGLGPEQAVLDAIRDALDQLEREITSSSQVRLQLKHYKEIDQARKATEIKI